MARRTEGQADRRPNPSRELKKLGAFTITITEVALVIVAVFVVLAYFHGWG